MGCYLECSRVTFPILRSCMHRIGLTTCSPLAVIISRPMSYISCSQKLYVPNTVNIQLVLVTFPILKKPLKLLSVYTSFVD